MVSSFLNCRSAKQESLRRKSRTNFLHKESTKTAAFLNKIGAQSKPRLTSNTSSTTDFRLDKTDKNDLIHECQYLTIFSFEIFCHTNEPLAYAIDKDEVCAIFYTVASETTDGWKIQSTALVSTHLLRVTKPDLLRKSFRSLENKTIEFVKDELELIERFTHVLQQADPDIVICYEMKLSLYYLIKRAKTKYHLDLLVTLSRVPEQQENVTRSRSHMGADGSDLPVIVGRILLELWKILRSEITLNIYTFENAIYHVLHERVPRYDFSLLSKWFIDEGKSDFCSRKMRIVRWRLSGLNPSFGLRNFVTLLDYGWTRSIGNFRLIYELDLITKTSEFARIYGIEFYHVRGNLSPSKLLSIANFRSSHVVLNIVLNP